MSAADDRLDWPTLVPWVILQTGCVAVFWTGWSWVALAAAAALYAVRMFAITAFYHRYFSHRTFRTNRFWQFCFGLLGATAAQRGPLWWAAHHRVHHLHSDGALDPHSPARLGFWWSHLGWFVSKEHVPLRTRSVPDFMKFPELVWLDRLSMAPPVALGVGLYFLGAGLAASRPDWGTSGWQMVAWGFCVSTTLCYHATYTINSLAHCFGHQPYQTGDDSRNNWLLALVTFGEGWHNNHHRYPTAARQGFLWWEFDLSYWLLRGLAVCGVVRDLRPVPAAVLAERGA